MKRLVWMDTNKVRAFGCAGCGWTFPVKEFTPEFSHTEVREDFHHHDCDDPRFTVENSPGSELPGAAALALPSVSCDQALRDLCGLQGSVLASIEALSASAPPEGELAAVEAKLDSVRSLLWLHMHASPAPPKGASQLSPATDEKRRWPRYKFDVPVTITTGGSKKIEARGTELNEGGLTVCGEAEFSLGDDLRVEFRPPFSSSVVNLAVVVRNRLGNRYGMEFVGRNNLERQEIALLRTIVKMLAARVGYYGEPATK